MKKTHDLACYLRTRKTEEPKLSNIILKFWWNCFSYTFHVWENVYRRIYVLFFLMEKVS